MSMNKTVFRLLDSNCMLDSHINDKHPFSARQGIFSREATFFLYHYLSGKKEKREKSITLIGFFLRKDQQ